MSFAKLPIEPRSSRAKGRDLAREWVERGAEDPSVAALPQDDTGVKQPSQSSLGHSKVLEESEKVVAAT
jgi:hypothetical protein